MYAVVADIRRLLFNLTGLINKKRTEFVTLQTVPAGNPAFSFWRFVTYIPVPAAVSVLTVIRCNPCGQITAGLVFLMITVPADFL